MCDGYPNNFPFPVTVQNIIFGKLTVIRWDWCPKIYVHGICLLIIAYVHIFYMAVVHGFQHFQYIFNLYFCRRIFLFKSWSIALTFYILFLHSPRF